MERGGQQEIQKLLSESLVKARLKNPSFSLRAMARKLSLAPSALSEILSGKRRVSLKLARRLTHQLALSREEQERILESFAEDFDELASESPYAQIGIDEFKTISDWQHFAILYLAQTKDFQEDPEWISARLKGLDASMAARALERLERLGFLVRIGGKLKVRSPNFSTSDEVVNLAVRQAHIQDTELVLKSIESDPVELRDITSMTMAIDPAKLPQAKKMIRRFQDRLAGLMEEGQQSEVYRLCMQLMPLTRVRNAA
jgi:uncharacterized protein (TIGR02147 family)